jgi:hypothetical protein
MYLQRLISNVSFYEQSIHELASTYLSYPLTSLTASHLANDLSLAPRITLEPALSRRISLIASHHQLLIIYHCTAYF